MDREQQIEEMAKNVCHLDRTCDECMTSFECKAMTYAKRFYEAGYRKSKDVAMEIFEEIEKTLKECLWFLKNHPSNYPSMDRTKINVYKDNLQYIAELKKKYTDDLITDKRI